MIQKIKCWIGIHSLKQINIRHFDSPQMDDRGNVSDVHKVYLCKECGRIISKAFKAD
jgi:hypothetical protein